MTQYQRVVTWRIFGDCPTCRARAGEPCVSLARRPDNRAVNLSKWAHPGRPKGFR